MVACVAELGHNNGCPIRERGLGVSITGSALRSREAEWVIGFGTDGATVAGAGATDAAAIAAVLDSLFAALASGVTGNLGIDNGDGTVGGDDDLDSVDDSDDVVAWELFDCCCCCCC